MVVQDAPVEEGPPRLLALGGVPTLRSNKVPPGAATSVAPGGTNHTE